MMIELARETLTQPRRILARVLAQGLTAADRWQAFAAVIAVSTLLSWLFIMAVDRDGSLIAITPNPVMLAVANALLLLGVTLAVHAIGRGFGGTGRFSEALLAITLLQAIMLVVQVAQMLILLVSIPVGELFGIVALVLLLWLFANFIMQLHGFQSLARVAIGIVVVFIALSMLLSMILVIIGLSGPGV